GRASRLDALESELTGYIRNAAQKRAKSKLELIQAEVSAMGAKLNRNNSYAAVQESLGYVYDSMGVDPLDGSLVRTDLSDVSNHLAANLGTWTKAEQAPFNWACYAPEREDQAYDAANFRLPKKVVQQAVADANDPEKVLSLDSNAMAEKIANIVMQRLNDGMPDKALPTSGGATVKQSAAFVSPAPMMPMRKFETVQFNQALTGITPQSAATLDRAIEFLRKNPTLMIQAVGFSDSGSGPEESQKASVQRAQAVYRYLVDSGVERKRIVILASGPSMPVASNDTPEGRAKNRRVELYVFAMDQRRKAVK
ncbi:MAG: OmpA family protein, partial [Mariprofundaceae bacterium]|nr:OmpA family protein [Mariprofundaceae bacterium]